MASSLTFNDIQLWLSLLLIYVCKDDIYLFRLFIINKWTRQERTKLLITHWAMTMRRLVQGAGETLANPDVTLGKSHDREFIGNCGDHGSTKNQSTSTVNHSKHSDKSKSTRKGDKKPIGISGWLVMQPYLLSANGSPSTFSLDFYSR